MVSAVSSAVSFSVSASASVSLFVAASVSFSVYPSVADALVGAVVSAASPHPVNARDAAMTEVSKAAVICFFLIGKSSFSFFDRFILQQPEPIHNHQKFAISSVILQDSHFGPPFPIRSFFVFFADDLISSSCFLSLKFRKHLSNSRTLSFF